MSNVFDVNEHFYEVLLNKPILDNERLIQSWKKRNLKKEINMTNTSI